VPVEICGSCIINVIERWNVPFQQNITTFEEIEFNFDRLTILYYIWAGHVARIEKRNACRIFVGKPKRKRPLERPRRRWVDNIEMDLREIGWDGLD
jgi:hypothetical protein